MIYTKIVGQLKLFLCSAFLLIYQIHQNIMKMDDDNSVSKKFSDHSGAQ